MKLIKGTIFFCLLMMFALGVMTNSSQLANAQLYEVGIAGEVEFNQINNGVLGNINAGDAATIVFVVDSSSFVDSPNFPTRGYDIQTGDFSFDFGGANTVGLQMPFPPGSTPYFVLRDNDPAVDGFFLSTNIDNPFGVPLNQTGQFGEFSLDFMVTYGGEALPSLDITDAAGMYDFDGLSVFNLTVSDGPFNAMGLIFTQMSIEPLGTMTCQNPLGDVNLDFAVNLLDVAAFVQAVVSGEFQCEADFTMDGTVDLLDVAPFVAALAGG